MSKTFVSSSSASTPRAPVPAPAPVRAPVRAPVPAVAEGSHPHPGTIAGLVTGPSGPVAGAAVEACLTDGRGCLLGTTDAPAATA